MKVIDFLSKQIIESKTPIEEAIPPNEELVKVLQDLLEQAKLGNLRSGIFLGMDKYANIVDCWNLDPDDMHVYALLGGLHVLMTEFTNVSIELRYQDKYENYE
jgi:hypothetical protein